jgi:hypothetical protein
MPLQMLSATLLPQMLLSLWLTCLHTGPYSLAQCSLFFWHIFLLIDADSFRVRGSKPGCMLLSLSSKRNNWVTLFQRSRHTLPLYFDVCYLGCFEWFFSWIALEHNASSPNPNFPSPFLHCSLNLSPLITFALFVARKVAMFSFCAVMTDVNYAPLNGPPSPLLTSGISQFLDPNSKGTRDGCINFSREPSRLALTLDCQTWNLHAGRPVLFQSSM